MAVKKVPAASSSILDVLERVLDRGIVIDAWIGVSLAGLRVLELDTRIVVASLDTYLSRGEELAIVVRAQRPALKLVSPNAVQDPRRSSAPPPPPIASLPRRRRGRQRKRGPQPAAAASPATRLRCESGCTFEWVKIDSPPASMPCPYRKRTRCSVVAN